MVQVKVKVKVINSTSPELDTIAPLILISKYFLIPTEYLHLDSARHKKPHRD